MQTPSAYVHCMLIPMDQDYLLLPNTTIAEVIPMPNLIAGQTESPDILGFYHWRDNVLPVIALSKLINGNTVSSEHPRQAHKLCIINGVHAAANLSLYAAPCNGVPQLITLNESALRPVDDMQANPWVYSQLKMGNKVAYIPNLDALEKHLQNQLHTP